MNSMTTSEIIAEIRRIRRDMVRNKIGAFTAATRLFALENAAAPCGTNDLVSVEIDGFDTVLGYLAKNDPAQADLTYDLTHDTVAAGKRCATLARARGLPILRVKAPAAVSTRYPKVTKVNAYPVHLLAEVLS